MNNLNGSEKQIAWATDIRKEFIEKTKADMKSADKNDVLDMKAMLKVADNITEAADWINARRNPKIMFFDRADFWEARREIKAAEKPAKKEDSGRKPSIREMLKAKIAEKNGDGASAPTDEEPRIVYDLSDWDFLSKPAEDRPCYLRFTADDKDSGSHAEIITNRHGEGRWLRDSTTGDYIQISGTSQYRLPRTKNALKCQLAFRLRR